MERMNHTLLTQRQFYVVYIMYKQAFKIQIKLKTTFRFKKKKWDRNWGRGGCLKVASGSKGEGWMFNEIFFSFAILCLYSHSVSIWCFLQNSQETQKAFLYNTNLNKDMLHVLQSHSSFSAGIHPQKHKCADFRPHVEKLRNFSAGESQWITSEDRQKALIIQHRETISNPPSWVWV